jgi:hypothetical protein
MQELIEKIQSMEGLLEFNIESGYWQDEDGEEVQVNLIIILHTFDAFNDPIYDELMDLYPENTDEFDRDEEVYTSTFIDYKV